MEHTEPTLQSVTCQAPSSAGLLNPRGADIHLVVHDHGLLSPDGSGCLDIQFTVHEQ